MRPASSQYPVDRYLVESSKKFEMVNIIDDEIWNPEPALRPEDEIILRKLHEMLQSTAEDLKQLSGELSKFHEPGVQVKTLPTPLDEEFNEKVHIEEVVNAKFHGYKIIDTKSPHLSNKKSQNNIVDSLTTLTSNLQKPKVVNTGVQVNTASILKKPLIGKKLAITRTKIMQIDENNEGEEIRKDSNNVERLNNGKIVRNVPAVTYNEFIYKYTEPKVTNSKQNALQIQEMPKINIRSELKEQKVLNLDIFPETNVSKANIDSKSNVAVIAIEHETAPVPENISTSIKPYSQSRITPNVSSKEIKQPVRKISKMSTCESSESTTNISSDAQHKLKTYKQVKTVIKLSPKSTARIDRTKLQANKKGSDKQSRTLDEWKRKLNSVYGQPSTSRKTKTSPKSKEITKRVSSKLKSNLSVRESNKPKPNVLNNAEYIPYSQLTLGGVRVSDIERELSDFPNDLPLSPILDKIISSRENSFHKDSPRRKEKNSPKILTTSDENLLQEVVDIEKTIKNTISKNKKKLNDAPIKPQNISSESNAGDDYADDFEEEKSDNTISGKQTYSNHTEGKVSNISSHDDDSSNSDDDNHNEREQNLHNVTYTKTSNLSFKNTVDVFEFVHSVDTQDTATQSNTTHKISLKETQTSPRNEASNIQPIHNDLWPSIDPQGRVEEMFKLEKDFIKKLITDEYSDLLEKNITKPSTSKDSRDFESSDKNVAAYQKNTQTSPAHVKSVMTSPTRTKTRTTSPFKLSLTVDQQTSPLIFVTNEEEVKLEIENAEDAGISINLSSPRFSLRLPQTSREVISNLEGCSRTPSKNDENESKPKESKTFRKNVVSSSSSVDGDRSSSDISSLGEIKLKLKRRLRRNRISSISESSFSSTVSKYSSDLQVGGILPLRSEGEISLGQNQRDKSRKSDGETSYGPLLD